jgi:hypothetical protein
MSDTVAARRDEDPAGAADRPRRDIDRIVITETAAS